RRERRIDPSDEVAAAKHGGALGQGGVRSTEPDRQDVDAMLQGQVTDRRLERQQAAIDATRTFREDQDGLALLDELPHLTECLTERTAAGHRHQIGELLEVRLAPAISL